MRRPTLLLLARAGALILALSVLTFAVGSACRSGPRAAQKAPKDPGAAPAAQEEPFPVSPPTKAGPVLPGDPAPSQGL